MSANDWEIKSALPTQSENIGELAAALSKAQGEIQGALKDSKNPFFKSNYADLASCWDACRSQLSKNALAIIQTTSATDGASVEVLTTLAHSSGQWIAGRLRMTPKEATPQSIGSCITYARRYALAGIVGIAQIDDDAEAAHGRTNGFTKVDPRGEEFKKQDQNETGKVASEVRGYINEGRDLDLYDVHERLVASADFYIAVADKLTPKERKAWKDAVHKVKEDKRNQPMRADGRAA